MSDRRLLVAGIALAMLSMGTAIALQIVRDEAYPRQDADRRAMLYVRSPEALRRIVLSFDALAADVYWIRALQHFGGDRRSTDQRRRYELLYPLLDLTTSLDPYFNIAYRFGAIFLSEPYPSGGGRPDQAVALLRKGLSVQPTKWQYYHDIAFVYYWQLRDMEAAAKWFRLAAAQPGAPNWLDPVAATMLIQGGDRASARFLLREILESEEPWLRNMASRGLTQVDALDMMDELRQWLAAHPPPPGESYSWQSYLRRGALRAVPSDPSGTPFVLDPATGAVSVAPQSPLYPMPTYRTGT